MLKETTERKRKRLPVGSTLPAQSPKQQMAQVFKYYFAETSQDALSGTANRKIDYQIHTGPAIGSFNQWVKNTDLEDWRKRHVDQINTQLMLETQTLVENFASLMGSSKKETQVESA